MCTRHALPRAVAVVSFLWCRSFKLCWLSIMLLHLGVIFSLPFFIEPTLQSKKLATLSHTPIGRLIGCIITVTAARKRQL